MKKSFKKIMAALLAAVLTFCVFGAVPFAADADIAVKLVETTYVQGDEFKVEIYFPTDYNKVATLDMSLVYDSTKLEVISSVQGKDLRTARDKQVNGEVYSQSIKTPGKVNWCLSGGNNYEFFGVFAEVSFKVKTYAEHGSSDITLKINSAYNSGSVSMSSNIKTSGVSINILRDSTNDMVFELNKEKTGYIVTDYLCASYESVVIPDEYKGLPIIGIGNSTFYNHAEIKDLTIPSTVTYIGERSFYGCSGLDELVIPENVESIKESAFEECTGLKSLSLPYGLKTILPGAFMGCIFLESVEIPFTVKSIGANAFRDCLLLSKVKISKNTTIGLNAFMSCSDSLKFISVENNESLQSYIKDCAPNAEIEYVEDISLGTVSDVQIQSYKGSPITPTVSVNLTSGYVPVLGVNYKVVYRNNNKVGTATVYIVGINGYGEGYAKEFSIICLHADVNKELTKKATCTVDGYYTVTCNDCGETFREVIKASGHLPTSGWTIDTRPTVSSVGSKHKRCRICKQNIELTEIPKSYPDANKDSKINSSDALIILQYSVGSYNGFENIDDFMNVDTNGDNRINSVDALTVLKISVGSITL